VLEMSKIEAGRVSLVDAEFDLHALLEESREMFAGAADAKGLALSVRCDAAVPQHLNGDAVKLRQVLINLLSNAVKFTARGSIELRVSLEAPGLIPILGFQVSDTGVGIAADELLRLGHAFQQASAGQRAAEGTGLGLAISRGFVQLMGGELRLTSTPGLGTCVQFTVAMQLAEGGAPGLLPGPVRRPLGLAPGTPPPRILVVDDRAEGRRLLARTLSPIGFEVREAGDGEQALAEWERWSPQLILMDMRMPVMDGWEATRRIKATQRGRSTVVVALTASSFEEERDEILAAGCDDLLRKPFQEEVLFGALARHLSLRYAYDDDGSPAAGCPEPDRRRIAMLPRALRDRLRCALEQLDVQAVDGALEEMRAHDPTTTEALAPLAGQFQYARMRALLAEH
jgi:CheY-like chemotaxis protein